MSEETVAQVVKTTLAPSMTKSMGDLVEAVIQRYCVPAVAAEYERAKKTHRTEFEKGFGLTMFSLYLRQVHALCHNSVLQKSMDISKIDPSETDNPLVKLVCRMQNHKHVSGVQFLAPALKGMEDRLKKQSEDGRNLPEWIVTMSHERDRQEALKTMNAGAGLTPTNMSMSTVKKEGGFVDGFVGKEDLVLKKVLIKDLRLYATLEDHVLEGVIITPPVVRTAVDIVIRDSRGDVLRTQIYNSIPVSKSSIGIPGADRQQLAEEMFGKGMQIRIVDPYFKMSEGGFCTVRVDDPREVQTFWKPAAGKPARIAPVKPTATAREKGNAAIHNKLHDLALYEYKSCFAHGETDEIVSILLNRSENLFRMGEHKSALADAAAVLTLRPEHAKGWKKYTQALLKADTFRASSLADLVAAAHGDDGARDADEDGAGGEGNAAPDAPRMSSIDAITATVRDVLGDLSNDKSCQVSSEGAKAVNAALDACVDTGIEERKRVISQVLNSAGVAAYKEGENATAVYCFTQALLFTQGPESDKRPLAAVANNAALACLHSRRPWGAFAYLNVACRLIQGWDNTAHTEKADSDADLAARAKYFNGLAEKATARAGDAAAQLGINIGGPAGGKMTDTIVRLNKQGAERVDKDLNRHLFLDTNAKDVPNDWVHPGVQIRELGASKGRGVFATQDFKDGGIIMLTDFSGVHVARSEEEKRAMGMYAAFDRTGGGDEIRPELLNRVLWQMRDDVMLACKLSHLHDGFGGEDGDLNRLSKEAPDSFRELTDHIPSYVLPLLPASPAHLWKSLPSSVKSAYRSTSEVRIRDMLDLNSHGRGSDHSIEDRDKKLLVPIALLNHSNRTNCEIMWCGSGGRTLLLANGDIAAGTELVHSYGVIKEGNAWGIPV